MRLRKPFAVIRLLPLFVLLLTLFPDKVRAASYTATQQNRDFYFTLVNNETLTVRTYANQYGIDSMLWLYNSSNQLLAYNDDYFDLDSYISISLQSGTYRLRAGICCRNPDAWYGSSYLIDAYL